MFCRRHRRGFSADGTAECTFISLPGCLGVFRAVSAGYFALGGKVTKTPPAPFGPDHRFVQSDTSKGDARLPLKYLFAFGLLVIGATIYELRLTALVLGVVSCFFAEGLCGFNRVRKPNIAPQIRLSLQKGVSRSWTRNPPQIRC